MGHILKNECIQVEGRVRLSTDGSTPGKPTEATSGDLIRIVEQHADHSIIEVVCSCGQTLCIRCDHPA